MSLSLETIASQDAIIKIHVSDLTGSFKSIIFPSRVITELVEVGIAYDGSSFTGINEISSSDAIVRGVEESIIQVPQEIADSEKSEYWLVGNILSTDHTPHPNCARQKLLSLQEELAQKWDGGKLMMGSEPEAYFISLEKRATLGKDEGGNSNYFNPKDPKSVIITHISNVLDAMEFDIERAHTEVGDDQFEINWRFDVAERTSDKIQMFKLLSHKIATLHGYDVTFLPKPYPSRNGSGMHCHLSVQNETRNLFYDADAKENKFFSEKSLQFLTGILHHSRAISAIANSTEVSYARLVPGFEAPCVIAMGECNRTAACRIPAFNDPKIISKAIRAEMRYPDPLANPYLLASAFIVAGLDGLKNETEFCGFTEENLYKLSLDKLVSSGFEILPRNLWEAYLAFTQSDVLRNGLGESIHASHAKVILDEIDECQRFANARSMEMHYLG